MASPTPKVQVTRDEKGEIVARLYVTVPFGPADHGRTSVTHRDLELEKADQEAIEELLEGIIEKYQQPVLRQARKDAAQQNYLAEVRGVFDRPPGEEEAPAEPKLHTHRRKRK